MSHLASQVSVCRRCHFYNSEGRRGGSCQRLSVQVQGNWKSCQLAIPPFAPTWEVLESVAGLHRNDTDLAEVITSPEPAVAHEHALAMVGLSDMRSDRPLRS